MGKKKLFGIASLLCSAALCVGVGVAAANAVADPTPVTAEEASSTYTWSTEGGRTFKQFNYFELEKKFSAQPKTIIVNLANHTATKNCAIMGDYGVAGKQFAIMKQKAGYPCLFQKGCSGQSGDRRINFTEIVMDDWVSGEYHTLAFTIDYENASATCYDLTADVSQTVLFSDAFTDGKGTFADEASDRAWAIGGDLRANNSSWYQGAMRWVAIYSDIRTEEELAADAVSVDVSDETLAVAIDLTNEADTSDWSLDNLADSENRLVSCGNTEAVTITDIADFQTNQSIMSNDNTTMGITLESKGWNASGAYSLQYGSVGTGAVGLTARVSNDVESFNTMAAASTNESWKAVRFFVAQIGTRLFAFDMRNTANLRITAYRYGDKTYKPDDTQYSSTFINGITSEYLWDISKEHVVTVTRAPHSTRSNVTVYGVYVAEVATDGTVGKTECLWKFPVTNDVLEASVEDHTYIDEQIAMYPATSNSVSHKMTISSAKYVGVKTVVGEEATVNKVVRGGNFTFTDISSTSQIHVGWSKGAETYSAEDYVAPAGTLTNVTSSVVYSPLTVGVDIGDGASLRFRQRDGADLEASLRWKTTVSDYQGVMTYFGNEELQFGEKLTVEENDNCYEADTLTSNTDGSEVVYYVTQSNIGDSYNVAFMGQAYVKITIGDEEIAFYSAKTASRTQAYVAESAANDYKDVSGVVEVNGVNVDYKYEITVNGETKYHYLPDSKYQVLVNIVNNAKNAQ